VTHQLFATAQLNLIVEVQKLFIKCFIIYPLPLVHWKYFVDTGGDKSLNKYLADRVDNAQITVGCNDFLYLERAWSKYFK
jgi:hypothetical protein